ncbi:ABC transporter permease [Fundicoccus culcitae]|uniref:ABC transporter permease n=1 Tax=Fundicoccus culcitae TaxID=2969821 RepID=A0ABY5P754_9LACT|nr:ABC transporter permease [Fundicoccus culcitae]UUX34364.1 ABC transporter permease [Fundicoccus culcitae]
MRNLWIIIKEVYFKNVKSWSFVFMVLGPILVLGVIALITFFIAQDEQQSRVGEIAIIDAPTELQVAIDASPDNNTIHFDISAEEANTLLIEDKLDGYLVIEGEPDHLVPLYYRRPTSRDINLTNLEQVINTYQLNTIAENIGLNNEQLMEIQSSNVAIDTINLTVDDEGTIREESASDPSNFARIMIAYVVSFLVFFFIMTYVGIISQEIAAEKGSRIMEILLSSVSASTHFFGKMLGIALVILTQIMAYIILFILARIFFSNLDIFNFLNDIDFNVIFANSMPVVWLGLVFAIIGIMIYSALAGFLGSLVSKTEDVNKSITPIIFIALAGFYIGMYALNSTNNPIVRIGSLIPFFTPFVMPFRIAAETVSSTEIILAIIISIIFMILCLWFSVVFYKSNVLVYTDKGIIQAMKDSWTLWRSERQSK